MNGWVWRSLSSTKPTAARWPRSRANRRRRPEELRLLEALLFAAGEPLDEKTLPARLPEGVDLASAMRRLQAEYAPRGVNLVRVAGKWTFRTANDLAWLLARESVEPTQALARRHRDARDHRLSPAGDARRDRGHPRRHDLEGHDRRAAGDRLDPAARPPQGAGPPAHLRHHRGVPVAFRPRGDRRSAGPRRAERRRPARRPPAGRLLGADAVRRSDAARRRGPARAGRSRSCARAPARAAREIDALAHAGCRSRRG